MILICSEMGIVGSMNCPERMVMIPPVTLQMTPIRVNILAFR
ncbi:MAG: hypothetical protein ACFE8G_02515 [Candidatus Hermodarchaeota archaeon]